MPKATALYTYAVDGSGVHLRVAVEVIGPSGLDMMVVRVAPEHRDLVTDRYAGRVPNESGYMKVRLDSLTEVGSDAPLASFNFLD